MGLGLKLTLRLVVVAALVAAISSFIALRRGQIRRQQAITSSQTIARLVMATVLEQLGQGTPLHSRRVRGLIDTFWQLYKAKDKRNHHIVYAVLLDTRGEVVTGKATPELVVFPGDQRLSGTAAVLEEVSRLQGNLGGHMRKRRFPLRILDGTGKATDVGTFLVGLSMAKLDRDLRRDLLLSVGAILFGSLLLIGYAMFTLRRLVVAPLGVIAGAMDQVRDGDLTEYVDIVRSDEIGVLAHSYNFMVTGLREREHLVDAFNRYVSEKVYEQFKGGEITLSGERRHATILFSDIRAFTALSEQLTPDQVVAMLNEYFGDMVDVVLKYEGYVNKFMGDALMAVYNVPVAQEDPELRAVRTGLDMLYSLDRLNERRTARGEFPIRIGVGINTGPVVAGNIGHHQRLEYTVIGDAVNLAQRIEGQTKVAGSALLISESTYRVVAQWVEVDALPPVKIKGKAEPVALYAVRGLRARPRAAELGSPPLPR